MESELLYNGKPLPTLLECEVLVIGGGLAGICAALGAARAGAKTVLVERNGTLGGQAAEIDTWGIDGFVDNFGHQMIRGIPWEILERTIREGGSDPAWLNVDMELMEKQGVKAALRKAGLEAYVPYMETGTYMNPFNDQYVNPNAYRYAAQCMLEEAGVRVLLDMPVVDVLMDGNRVCGVVTLAEFQKYALRAQITVDTSQQALVCSFAGKQISHRRVYMGTLPRVAGVDIEALLDYMEKTPGKWLVRPMVGKAADVSEMRALARGGNPLAIHGFEHALAGAAAKNPAFKPLVRKNNGQLMFFYERDGMGAYWTFGDDFNRVQADDPLAMAQAVLAGRKQQWLMHKFFVTHIPGFEHAHLADTYPHISKAYEQSDAAGDFTEYGVTPREILEGTTDRSDVILRVMGHPRSGQCPKGWLLPYGALIPRGLEGILVAGKPASRKIHYIVTCGAVGQAAGVAAAEAARGGTTRGADASRIAGELARQGAIVQ